MGKTTHYHPLSLHVIRGAAEYCGWKFSKIAWVDGDEARKRATYVCLLSQLPRGAADWSLKTIKSQLQHCFMDDITVDKLWCLPGGDYMCSLIVDLQVEETTMEHRDGEL